MLTAEAAAMITGVFRNRWRTLMSLDDVIGDVIELCESPDVETARLACGAVANVAEDNMTHRPLLFKANALHSLAFPIARENAAKVFDQLLASDGTLSMRSMA